MAKIDNNVGGGSGYATPKQVGWTLNYSTTLIDPVTSAEACRHHGVDPSWWQSKAGTILWPSGMESAKIWILLSREDLDLTDLNGLHTLKVRYDNETMVFRNLVFSAPCRNIMGQGYRGEKKATYLCELSDQRHLVYNKWFANPVNVHYNVPAPDTGTVGAYHVDSTNGGSAWSWQNVLDSLWSLTDMPDALGASPQLGFSPTGVPQNLRFVGVPGWAAYNEVLDALSCQFVLWPDGSTYIVRKGADDELYEQGVAEWDNPGDRFDDEECLEIVRGKIPEKVRVYFPKVWEHYGSEKTTDWAAGLQTSLIQRYSIDVDCPDEIAGYAQEGSVAPVQDAMAAMTGIDGSVTNAALLLLRARERADDYYRTVYTGGVRTLRTFNRWIFDTRLFPGPQVSAVAWYDKGQGARMQVFNSAAEFRMDCEKGCFRERYGEATEAYTPPDFARQSFANYPHLLQICENVSAVPNEYNVYDGYINYVDPTGASGPATVRGHRVWIYDPNNP